MTVRTGLLRHVLIITCFGAAAGLAAGLSCRGDDDPRQAVLAHVAHAVAVPAFTDLRDRAQEAADAVAALCLAPDAAALDAARAAWDAERDAWGGVLPLNFGPLEPELSSLDFWPARAGTIEDAIVAAGDAAAIDITYVAGLGISARGMPALGYLLWGEDPEAVLAAMSDPALGPRRCAYAEAVADDISARAELVRAAWADDFAAALASAGDGSEVYATVRLALDDVVNHEIDALATVVKAKLDNPLGNLGGAAVDPTLLESRFSGRSLADLQANLTGVWRVYHGAGIEPGAPAAGLSVLVRERDPDLDDRLRAQYDRARAVLSAVPEPLASALVDDRAAVQMARDELDGLRRMIKLDVASQLGVTLSLSDNDGD